MDSPPTVVLDTNVVLDWLVFRNPGCAPLTQAIKLRQVRWVATAPMEDELRHVLGCGGLSKWNLDEAMLWESWRLHSEIIAPGSPSGDALRLCCTDPDDQKFIDLALTNAQWLISRDRAVLKLANRARRLGVRFATPEQWAAG